MKKALLAAALVLVAAAALPAADLHLTTSLDVMAGVQSISITPSVAFTWQPKFFGVGAELKLPIGTSLGDTYLEAFALLKLGWFDLGVGVSTMVAPPTGDTTNLTYTSSPSGLLFAARLGLTAPLFTLGPGKLGFNASLDVFETETKLTQMPSPSSVGDLVAQIFVYPIIWLFDMAVNSVKLSAGVNYTIDL